MINSLQKRPSSLNALAAFLAACVFSGSAAQLFMELSESGAAAKHLVSPVHVVLASLLVGSAGALLLMVVHLAKRSAGGLASSRAIRREFAYPVSPLSGWRFYLTTLVFELSLGVGAQLLEPGSDSLHDVVGWLVATLFVAIVATLVARLIVAAVPTVIAVLAAYFHNVIRKRPSSAAFATRRRPLALHLWRSSRLFSRPPPPLQT